MQEVLAKSAKPLLQMTDLSSKAMISTCPRANGEFVKIVGGIFSLIAIFVAVKLVFGLGQAIQDAGYEPVPSDDPRLVMNGGECEVILSFPDGTSDENRKAEATLFLVKNKDVSTDYRWDALPNGDYCIS